MRTCFRNSMLSLSKAVREGIKRCPPCWVKIIPVFSDNKTFLFLIQNSVLIRSEGADTHAVPTLVWKSRHTFHVAPQPQPECVPPPGPLTPTH